MSIVCFLADRLDRETCTKPIRKQKEEDYAACSEPSTHLLIYVDRNPETILPAVRIHHRPLYRRPSLTDDLGVYGKLSIFIRLRRQWGVMASPHHASTLIDALTNGHCMDTYAGSQSVAKRLEMATRHLADKVADLRIV